ncbi:MAG: imidazole glycerol phosphate synthase subunit HisF [Endomicrobium sp.]|jgi:cyclase|nr:imidazole glycerol phosphate synthase subunit HisF [Endomicrobium sp.]MDR2399337.1 imidazole glycerol phosphate synthase subunit HisF [Endomicrobium sp.]
MLKKRIISCLDIKDGRVVKGINFFNLTDIGDPVVLAKEYEKQGADEIVFLDISATCENRAITSNIIERSAKALRIPLTVGGGIRSIEDFRNVLKLGADKVSINSAAVNNPGIILQAAKEFGTQCVVVAIDTDGENIFINGGRVNSRINLVGWVKQCESLGAGEILLTSINSDGTKRGYDIETLNKVVDIVNIPVIVSGGCGSVNDIIDMFNRTDCCAALVASLLHYKTATVYDIKQEMIKNNIPVRRYHNDKF